MWWNSICTFPSGCPVALLAACLCGPGEMLFAGEYEKKVIISYSCDIPISRPHLAAMFDDQREEFSRVDG